MSTARKHYTRKLAAILTVLAMVVALFPVAAFAQFKDVGGTLAVEINKAYEAGLVSGYSNDTFRPNENVSRAAFAKMIVLAVEQATGEELPTGSEPFKDVRPGQALYDYVVKAYNAEFIKGYPDGTFGYNKAISRMEAAAILQRALNLPLKAENFKDVPDNSAFAKQIGAVAAAGIMKGYGDTFKPADNLTRGQAAAVAYRAYEYLGGKKPEEKLYEVTAVEQASDSSLRVKFNQAVEDTSAVQFDVKLDGEAVEVTPEWAEDKTSVELKVEGLLKPGTYTVKVSGLNFAEGKDGGQVTVEGYEVTKVEQASDSSLRVTFNKAVENTDVVKFEVKRGDQAVQVTPQWSEDKTSVELKASAKLLDGEYTVTVDGLIFAKDKNVGSAVVDTKIGVASVVAPNLKQIRIVFDKPVDVDSAEDESKYEVDRDGTGLKDLSGTATAKVVGDRTVYLTLNTEFSQQDVAKVRVDGVVAGDDKNDVLTSGVYEVKFFDTNEPAHTGEYAFVKPDTIRVYFTEPIRTADPKKFTLDDGSLAVATVEAGGIDGDKYYVDVIAGGTIPDGKHTLKIDVAGVTDFAGFKNSAAIELPLDLSAPKANVTVSVVQATQTSVRLKFSAPINAELLGTELFYHSFSSNTPQDFNPRTGYTDTIDLDFSNKPIPEGTVTLVVLKQNQDGTKAIKDAFGNSLASETVELPLTVVADKTPPSVESVKAIDAHTLEVIFSEAVNQADAEDVSNYAVKYPDGRSTGVSISEAKLSQGKVVTLTLERDLNGGNYQLEVKNIHDLAVVPNKLPSATVAFSVKDEKAPEIVSAVLYADGRTIEVRFSEQVEAASATNMNNYQLEVDGKRLGLPEGSKTTLDASGTVVKLVLGGTVQGLDGKNDTLYVANIRDLSGTPVAFGESKAIQEAPEPDIDTEADHVATSTRTVVVYFNQALSGVNASNIFHGSDMVQGATFENETLSDGTVRGKVTITLRVPIKHDKSDLQDIKFAKDAVTATTGTKNSQELTVEANAVRDGIAPELVKTDPVIAIDSDNKVAEKIQVRYTEPIDPASLALTTFEVEGYKVTGVGLAAGNSTVVELTVQAVASSPAQEPAVKQVGTVLDMAGNKLGPWSSAITAKVQTQGQGQ